MKNSAIFLSVCFFILLAGCVHETPPELKNLNRMQVVDAREKFLSLPPRTQVELVTWELENSKPSSSRYDYLLHKNGVGVAKYLGNL